MRMGKYIFLYLTCTFFLLACTPNYIKTDIMLAEDGDAKAQCRLGDSYYNGKGVFKNLSKAVVWYTKSAKQGDADAQFKLGKCFLNGRGVTRDVKLAAEWFEKSAAQGNSNAQIELGNCYKAGQGVEENYVKAIDLYAKAFRNGGRFYLEREAEFNNNRYAQFRLAECIFSGEEAVKWYTKSAEQGYVEAQKKLAGNYRNGWIGFPKDLDKASFWLKQAAENGDSESQVLLGDFYYNGSYGFPQNYTKAVEWWEKSLALAEIEYRKYVLYYLGRCYFYGNGVLKDLKKGFDYYYRSAQLDNADAQYSLALCYGNGQGVKKDFDIAEYWLKKAADNDHAEAKEFLIKLNKINEQ